MERTLVCMCLLVALVGSGYTDDSNTASSLTKGVSDQPTEVSTESTQETTEYTSGSVFKNGSETATLTSEGKSTGAISRSTPPRTAFLKPTSTVDSSTQTTPLFSFLIDAVNNIARNVSNNANPITSFLSTMMRPRPNNTSYPSTSLPSWAAGLMGKLPPGFDTSVLRNLLNGNVLNTSDIGKVFTTLGPMLPSLLRGIESNDTAASACNDDLDYFLGQLTTGNMWALKMLDAAGKPGPTILEGNFNFFGDFEECLAVVSDVNPQTRRVVSADTCIVSIGLPQQLMATMPVKTNAFGGPLAVSWHLCVPKTCSSKTVQDGVQKVFNSTVQLPVYGVVCHQEIKHGPVVEDMKAVGAIILTSILAALVLLGSALDLSIRGRRGSPHSDRGADLQKLNDIYKHVDSEKHDETSLSNGNGHVNGGVINGGFVNGDVEHAKVNGENGHAVLDVQAVTIGNEKSAKRNLCERLLLCFSAVTNAEKVLSVKNTPGSLTCLNGIRVLSIGWVLLGHSFFFMISVVDNPADAYGLMGTFNFQCIINGTLSVDSFFVLSGLLGTYLFLREIEKAGGLKVIHMVMYYVHRYLRLTPAYAFVLFLHTCLVLYITDGPSWTGLGDRPNCLKYWWVNLIYINNFYGTEDQCFGWAWFLANDMQFYIIAPLALIPFAIGIKSSHKSISNIIGSIVTLALILTGIIATAVISMAVNGDLFTNSSEYFTHIYEAPWCRVSAFAIGVAAGYILHKTRSDFKMPYFFQGVGWLLALIVAMACNYATYDENAPGRSKWGIEAKTAHETLFRPAWACVVSWVIVMCCSGKGGIVNWMLSWAWWQPLARLTYGTYLIHPILMIMAASLVRSTIHYTAPWIVLLFFGFTGLSYALAFVLSMLVEAPMLNLEKILLGR